MGRGHVEGRHQPLKDRLTVDSVAWQVGGRSVLADVSFGIKGGELVAVMGRNGAGKSTLMDIIAGLRAPSAGTVSFDGRSAAGWHPRDRARRMAHLPQMLRPDLPFVARELVLMGRYPHTDRWFESGRDHDEVERAMRRTHCWDLRERLIQTLSGGERQRVLLAACLAQSADILLFDEPSTHLDIDQQLHCFTLMQEECAGGAACVAVTHDLNLALSYATRLIVIADGLVALDVSVDEAGRSSEWLALFSPDLRLSTSATGRPWVSYS